MMSRLEVFARPIQVFDPRSREHRKAFHQFVKTSSWAQCPVRFVVLDDQGDLVTMIQRSLIEYYTNNEFRPRG